MNRRNPVTSGAKRRHSFSSIFGKGGSQTSASRNATARFTRRLPKPFCRRGSRDPGSKCTPRLKTLVTHSGKYQLLKHRQPHEVVYESTFYRSRASATLMKFCHDTKLSCCAASKWPQDRNQRTRKVLVHNPSPFAAFNNMRPKFKTEAYYKRCAPCSVGGKY